MIQQSFGTTATHFAKELGLIVIATARNPSKISSLQVNGVDQVVIDDGAIAPTIHDHFPNGFLTSEKKTLGLARFRIT